MVITMKFTKRLISMLLCILMLSAVASLSAGAKVTYVFGDFVYEKINNNTEFEVDEYTGTATTAVTYMSYNSLPITSIGSNAFTGNTTLETITFSVSLKYIQNYGFTGATALKTVNCKSTVELIGKSAFSGCTSLSSINLQDTVITEISEDCFFNCVSLSEVTLPETVTTIADSAFTGCESLSKITIPASVTEIADNAFNRADNVVIYCYTDSVAHTYAETNSIEYVLLDAPKETYILGDVDNDGDVSIIDATQIQLIIAKLAEPADDKAILRGDIDHDDVLSIMDATSIQRFVASYDDGLQIGETFEV